MGHVNIEIKARCSEPGRVREVLRARNVDFRGVDEQTDTYFHVEQGRLKLRTGKIENSLIFYERTDQAGPKQSDVRMCRIEPGSGLREVLEAGLGVLVEVRKRREIYFIENVKFHIDEVEGLGGFVEIEAIDEDGSLGRERLLEQCNEYMGLLGIETGDLMECSYSDMLLELRNGG